MQGPELIKIPYHKSTLYFQLSEFREALQRGKMILRRERQAQREQKAHEAADRRRDKMLGIQEV